MKKSLSDILRKMASMIVVDTTPTEEEIQRERQRVRCREETPPEGARGACTEASGARGCNGGKIFASA